MKYSHINQKYFGNHRYMILKFEGITLHPEKSMKNVIDFLGIKYNESMLQQTIMGSSTGSNN